MLILGRHAGDAILIDGGIRIVVLASDSRGVRLGIEAPRGIGVVREEIVRQIADENRRASTAGKAHAWPAASVRAAPAAESAPRAAPTPAAEPPR